MLVRLGVAAIYLLAIVNDSWCWLGCLATICVDAARCQTWSLNHAVSVTSVQSMDHHGNKFKPKGTAQITAEWWTIWSTGYTICYMHIVTPRSHHDVHSHQILERPFHPNSISASIEQVHSFKILFHADLTPHSRVWSFGWIYFSRPIAKSSVEEPYIALARLIWWSASQTPPFHFGRWTNSRNSPFWTSKHPS